jgi:UDP-GlcNAc3NAcA epimerase
MKIVSIVGARPQFIKLAPLSIILRKKHKEIILHTGQHYDEEMSSNFFSELEIQTPDYNLGIGSGNQGEQTGKMLAKIEEVLLFEMPDLVLIYGDTNTTLAGALASAKLRIPIGHIEAGLRSYNNGMPEEINRIIADKLSTLLFCPTKTSILNLRKEGIKKGVFLVGDVMYDSLHYYKKVAEKKSKILKNLGLKEKEFYLLTIHRAENTDVRENLKKIVKLLPQLEKKTVFPLHPRTKKQLVQFGFWKEIESMGNLLVTQPLSYLDTLILEKNAAFILTDSGGIQKEAFFFKTPCLTLRNETEWLETKKSGLNKVVGLDEARILNVLKTQAKLSFQLKNIHQITSPGACEKIAGIISKEIC